MTNELLTIDEIDAIWARTVGHGLPSLAFTRAVESITLERAAKIADRHHIPMCDTTADMVANEIRQLKEQKWIKKN
jgi:hypothetical protein